MQPGDRVLDACCGTGDLAVAAEREGGLVTGLDFSGEMLERARRKSDTIEWVQGDLLELPFADGAFDAATVGFGVRNVADLERALAELRRVLRPGGRLAILEITQPRGVLRPFFSLWFDRIVPLLGRVLPGGKAYTYLPASVRRFPACGGSRRPASTPGVRGRLVPAASAARSSRSTAPSQRRRRERALSAIAVVRAAPGLGDYLDDVEERLAEPSAPIPASSPRSAATRSRRAASACDRCSPSSPRPPTAGAPVAEGAAVELVHMATLVHDDLDRRCPRAARSRCRLDGVRAERAARAAGDYLFARAFAELAATGDLERVRLLAEASLALGARRGDAATPALRPDTTVEAYVERCRAQDRQALRGRLRCSAGAAATTAGCSASRSRSSTTSSTARATRSRRARCPAPTCATARRRCRSSSPPATTRSCARRSPAGRSRACSCASRRPARSTGRARSRSSSSPRAKASARRRAAAAGARGARRRGRRPRALDSARAEGGGALGPAVLTV